MHCAKSFAYFISLDFKAALGVEYYYLHLTDGDTQRTKSLSRSAQGLQLSKRLRLKPKSFSLIMFCTLFSLCNIKQVLEFDRLISFA